MSIIRKLLAACYQAMEQAANQEKERIYRKQFDLHPTARLGYLPHIVMMGNISIGENSYFNSGKIVSGKNSKVVTGKWCAIAYNVDIHAISHDPDDATGPEGQRRAIEKDIVIGDHVWIGSNVFIRPGITIGNRCVIGANTVVTHDIADCTIVGGVPAKVIRSLKND